MKNDISFKYITASVSPGHSEHGILINHIVLHDFQSPFTFQDITLVY